MKLIQNGNWRMAMAGHWSGWVRGVAVSALAVAGFGSALEAQAPTGDARVGILVMAHGGIPEWDAAVVDAVEPVKAVVPTALALGMADPVTLQAALDSLRESGAEKVAVVRLFLSGESFLHDTEFYLHLRDDAPEVTMAMMMAMMPGGGHGGHGAHDMGPPHQLDLPGDVLMEMRGLSESPVVAGIVADRAHAVSQDPSRESVIVIAHGMGDEGENQRVLDNMAPSIELMRSAGYRDAWATTLREDWPEAREKAEAEIRTWVQERTARGDRVIVVPFRLFGFGGYAQVLDGLSYVPADGLLPHELVTEWIEESAAGLFCSEGITTALGGCRAGS